jgi:LysR family transcriptional regulator, glycine cleavage system transcriptional activator
MSSRLPLNALKVFEACARHGSFLKAADELAITPGAVSRQIKGLEAELEIRLFDRFNRAVRLTEAGEQLAAGVRQGLRTLQAAVDAVRSRRDAPLVVSVIHSIAAKWLAPRLHVFQQRHPDVRILVDASDQAVDLARDGIDIALRFGPGPYPGLDAVKMISTSLVPVCSPRLADELRSGGPDAMADVALLASARLALEEPGWPEWLAAAGARPRAAAAGPSFSNTYLAIEAAVAGRGVALAQPIMVIDDLAAGRLVAPFDFELPHPFGHWILSLPEKAQQPNIRRFRTWLLDQAAADGLRPAE